MEVSSNGGQMIWVLNPTLSGKQQPTPAIIDPATITSATGLLLMSVVHLH